jgi:molybdate transport system substrate-binding protein
VVGAAASLSEPIAAIAAGYEARHPGVRVRLVLGASSALAEQLRAGAPLAVLVAADPAITAGLAAEGLVEAEPRPRIARNRLALLVREELAPRFAGPAELDGAAIRRIALPAAAVPIGRYAREWLAGRGLLAAVEPRLVAVAHARAALAAVDAGDADAAIVYATDARLATSARSFEIPDAEQPEIAYEAALRTGAGPRAREFLAFLASDEAGRALAAAGLLPPRGVP